MIETDNLIKTSRFVVRTAFLLNRAFAASVIVGLPLSWLFSHPLTNLILEQAPQAEMRSTLLGVRLMMLLGIALSIAIDRLLVALSQIIETARAGDPFIPVNARRLQTIGWALLVLQLLDIPAALIEKFVPILGTGTPDPAFSIAGWMAVLMVFVLSRVFKVGSAMRDDLEGTI